MKSNTLNQRKNPVSWWLPERLRLKNKPGEIQALVHFAEGELIQQNEEQARYWLREAEYQLEQHPQAKRYNQLPKQIDKIRRSLSVD